MERVPFGNRLLGRLCIVTVLLGIPFPTTADRGGCPRYTDPDVAYRMAAGPPLGPAVVSAYEPAQRAVILWNGQEEILFLSTDLGHRTAAVMSEMIPLPAEPTVVKSGSLELFAKLAALGAKYGVSYKDLQPPWPTGYMTNLHVTTASLMRESFSGLAITKSLVREDIEYGHNLVSKMQARGYEWLVFDDVALQKDVQSFPPVEYHFKSNKIFYPLEISVNDYGDTRIDLVVITKERITVISETDYPVIQVSSAMMSLSDIGTLSPGWAAFMGSRPELAVVHLRISGDIRKMSKDLTAR